MSLSEIKKNQQKIMEKFLTSAKNLDKKSENNSSDPRIWKPTRGQDGNGSATIRFIGPATNEENLFVRVFYNNYTNTKTKKFYNEKSLQTIGKKDPFTEHFSKLYSSGKKDEAKQFKRVEYYYSNVLIIKDTNNPENDGKVFIFRYGKTIFDKVVKEMGGDDELGIEPTNVFCPFTGKNFVLKVKTVSGWANYDDSQFQQKVAAVGNDEYIEKIFEELHPIDNLIAEDSFLSYDELKKKFESTVNSDYSGDTGSKSESRQEQKSTKELLNDDVDYGSDSVDDVDDVDIDALLKDMDD
jgi:hypothetical protein